MTEMEEVEFTTAITQYITELGEAASALKNAVIFLEVNTGVDTMLMRAEFEELPKHWSDTMGLATSRPR
jgi:hypothetical protein